MLSIERALTTLFQSDAEATNFSAHVGWSIDSIACGYGIYGRSGAWIGGCAWIVYSLFNEFVIHDPEGLRERRLNLLSRLSLPILFLVYDLIRHI